MERFITFSHSNHKGRLLFLGSLIPLLVIILAIWLPYGFTGTGLLEEWGILGLFTTYGPIFFEHISGPLAQHALRPLMVFPDSLVYTLDPNSFNYWHLLTILSLLLKGIAASYLVWLAIDSRFWAVLMGILVLLLPADTMQLPLRPLQINLALAFLLLGSAFCVAAYQCNRPIITYSLVVLASFLLLFSMGMYEAACTLIFLPFMVIFVREGFEKTLQLCKSRMIITLLWIAPLAIYLAYCLIISPKIHSYQSTLFAGIGIKHIIRHSFPKLFSVGILRSLLGGWFDALRITLKEYSLIGYAYLFLISSIISGFLLFITKIDTPESSASTEPLIEKYKRLGLIGLSLIILGYAPFLLAPSHLVISQRTFLFATPGAAMVWIAFLAFLFHRKKRMTIFLVIFLVFIGFGAQLFQFEHYARLSDNQRYLLKNIVENFDGNLKNKTLVIFDESNQLDHTWMLLSGSLIGALTYFYDHPVDRIEICYLPTKEWRSPNQAGRTGTCIENKNNWTFRYSTLPIPKKGPLPKKLADLIIAKDNIIPLTIKPDGSISSLTALEEHRKQLRDDNNVTAIRYRNILALESGHFSKSLWTMDKSQYKWHFGDWWSMELPIKGSGWNEADWHVNYLFHHAFAWKSHEKATLLFNLVPSQKPYFLKGRFTDFIDPSIRKSMQVKINQQPLLLRWYKHGEFKTSIPPNILLSGVNTIEFDSTIDPKLGLAAKLRSIEVLTS
ncbi:MAG TPA: hypothetical protein VLI69_01630 [Gammaproteobacteria bacterium]|nr:hypothetical protein [Gammaproteobacteria bacterium]